MSVDSPAWTTPTRAQAAGFWLRTRGWIFLHGLRGWWQPQPRRWQADLRLATAPVVAQLRSPLWSSGPDDEFILTAGKVHNLRLAARSFDAVEIPAGATLSFWRQLGRPSRSRGYVPGREVRAGCVIPTIAGGICQLSNALATCAARAGFELVERHAHTTTLNAGGQLDATVFWNYVDLQIRAPVAWRIELKLTATELVLMLRAASATGAPMPAPGLFKPGVSTAVRNCLSCDETQCFRHRSLPNHVRARSAWLLDNWTPEFHHWLHARIETADCMQPVRPRDFIADAWRRGSAVANDGSNGWPNMDGGKVVRLGWTGLRRAAWLRLNARQQGRRQASVIDGQRWLAAAYARRLRPEHAHLVIDQTLLPHLQQQGVLGGRSYDVLAAALPMDEIQRRLDRAAAYTSGTCTAPATLTDYRAPPALVEAEISAMRGARCLVTAHTEVAAHWSQRMAGLDVRCVPWVMPIASLNRPSGSLPLVVFPASAIARKGAFELVAALRGLPCRLRVLGSVSTDAGLWQGIDMEQGNYRDDWVSRAAVVALPAHVEHAPRALLKALAAGVPVIATPACGVSGMTGVHLTKAGDVSALRTLLQQLLAEKNAQSSAAVAADEPRSQ